MTFRKWPFSEAFKQRALVVRIDSQPSSEADLAMLVVSDLEAAEIVLFDAPLKVFERSYDHLLGSLHLLSEEERQWVREHKIGVGHLWRGGSVAPPVPPRQPYFPDSNALEFLRGVYNGTLMGLDDGGKTMLD